MLRTASRTEELLKKANTLPLSSGVYIMKDKNDKVIYVGKSKKLKNRVSQYFQHSKKSIKTEKMVSCVENFDYIVCKTEIEALTLENVLIKQYSPKYNIKLKDAKAYPYIKITQGQYPRIVFTRKRTADKSKYFGPFSATSTAHSILDIIHKSLGIPSCKRSFPKDIGKERPCIYYQMGQCCGVCTGAVTQKEYSTLIGCAADILRGHSASSIAILEKQMMDFADREQYEAAARCRDAINSLRQLKQKQNVVASPDTNIDVFGLSSDDSFACISAIYIRDGAVTEKNDFSFSADAIIDSGALCAFLVEHYLMSSYIPKLIAVSFDIDESDRADLEKYLSDQLGSAVKIRRPERGSVKEICRTAVENAEEKVRQSRITAQKDDDVLYTLAKLLKLETLPERIEAYDISNIGRENITAGMVVFSNGRPQKQDYRSFNIRSVTDKPDDYASMKEALTRRFNHLREDTSGSFAQLPDLILVDGGKGHVSVAREAMAEAGLDIAIFGMVKDEFHKTRALCTDTEEINIAREHSVFMLIYKIQDEVHRFTVGKTNQAKRRTLKHSSLEKIDGIGPVKAKKLMGAMGTLSAIKNASVAQFSAIGGITEADAHNIYNYFHPKTDKTEK